MSLSPVAATNDADCLHLRCAAAARRELTAVSADAQDVEHLLGAAGFGGVGHSSKVGSPWFSLFGEGENPAAGERENVFSHFDGCSHCVISCSGLHACTHTVGLRNTFHHCRG
eukprot:scaffold133656_cov31-Prasinocladus_malaysianus.AAC.2